MAWLGYFLKNRFSSLFPLRLLPIALNGCPAGPDISRLNKESTAAAP